ESWGDGVAADGSHVSVQPMILPLFGGWSEIDVLAKFAGQKKPTGPEIVQETFKQVAQPADFVPAWAKFLLDGFLADSAAKPVALTLDTGGIDKLLAQKSQAVASDADTYEVVFVGD